MSSRCFHQLQTIIIGSNVVAAFDKELKMRV